MPVTILGPKTALVIIDLQHGMLSAPGIHPIAWSSCLNKEAAIMHCA